MDGHLRISPPERKRLLRALHQSSGPEELLRWNILLLLVDGHAWAHIAAVLYCSTATIARWQKRYLQHGMAGIAPVRESATLSWWVARIVVWVQTYTPTHFGYLRSRWCALPWYCSWLVSTVFMSAGKRCVGIFIKASWCGVVLVRSSGLTTPTMSKPCGNSSVCSMSCLMMRLLSFRMKRRSAPIPRLDRCG